MIRLENESIIRNIFCFIVNTRLESLKNEFISGDIFVLKFCRIELD